MIIYEDKKFQTRSDHPADDWIGDALYVVPDNSEIAEKIKAWYPYYEFVIFSGELIDVTYVEHEDPEPEPTAQDDVDAMLIDHEYRLTLLELGLEE